MAEEIIDLKIKGMNLVFEMDGNSDRHLATGTIPVAPDIVNKFKNVKLYKFICEKCNVGEMVFTPTIEENIYTFTHVCPNCGNTKVFNQIYPIIAIVEGTTLNDIESFNISFDPIFKI
jgi:hypothetical protein